MAKQSKTAFVCNECGADFKKWQGQCSECGVWNSLSEFRLGGARTKSGRSDAKGYAGVAGVAEIKSLDDIAVAELPRRRTGIGEFDRVLGGGLVPGSVTLLGGHPGAGKSTLLLQMCCQLAQRHSVLYVSGEESLEQIALRASRLQLQKEGVSMLAETDVDTICATVLEHRYEVVVIDSIQVMSLEELTAAPGSVSQVRESAAAFTRLSKQNQVIVLLVGHITKEGAIAGPKVLEHIIDASLMLEGSADQRFRYLRGYKNRFGAVNELGVFAMMEHGLREVKNPSAIFLTRSEIPAPGTVVSVVWEGTRPLLVEIQALVDQCVFGQPRRVTVGLEQNRLSMLLAVLHRHGGWQVGDQDVFVNVVGGIKVLETSVDLAVLMAVVSSFRDHPIPAGTVIIGEVGLTGEIRPVPNGLARVQEAAKHGLTRMILPRKNLPSEPPNLSAELILVDKLYDVLEVLEF